MRRTTLAFRLSNPSAHRDLLHEFTLHPGVIATSVDGEHLIEVQTIDSPAALWDVRATVGMFDDHAEELESQ